MKFAERMKLLTPSATFAVNTKALELRAKGVHVISLAVGEPDAPTPAHICEAAKEAIDQGMTRYTPA
ncbi:MAG: aspartate transaminase, partial [Mailhella sp.]|nr:aspartate transaminase [Mailhella sp.]